MGKTDAGKRLDRYARRRWADIGGKGGIRGLCRAAEVTPEQLYAWFNGVDEPQLGSLRALAKGLSVSAWELVAVMEDVDLEADRRARIAQEVAAMTAPLVERVRELEAQLAARSGDVGATTRGAGTPGAPRSAGRAA